jgi:hypothetical protein
MNIKTGSAYIGCDERCLPSQADENAEQQKNAEDETHKNSGSDDGY